MSAAWDVAGDPALLRACARSLADVTGELLGAWARASGAADAAVADWTGPRSVDAGFAAHGVIGQLSVAAQGVGGVAEALGDLAAALERAQADAEEARAQLRRDEVDAAITAHADPHVLVRARHLAADRADAARAAYLRAAEAFAGRVEEIAGDAVRVSSANDLAALGARRVVTPAVVAAAWRVLGGWVQPDCSEALTAAAIARGTSGSPAHVAAWWRSLSPLAQLTALRTAPDALGGLDGLPGWARDLANRQRLAALRADLRAQVDRFGAQVVSYNGRINRRFAPPIAVLARLQALDALVAVLARPGRQLLTLDLTGGRRVHAAVGIGDVDTADEVGVFTPGLSSTVAGSMDDYVTDLAGVRRQADALDSDDGRRSATVAWIGYDAPQWSDTFDPLHTVLSHRSAKVGGLALASFLTGVDASRGGQVHLVALGHSYGSTTTGYALARGGTGVDDVVLFGSPGYGTWFAGSLHVPAGHLYDVDAAEDPVGGTPVFGGDPALSPSFHHLSPWASDHGAAIYGHTSYLNPGTTSSWNIAAVLAGHPEQTVTAPFMLAPRGQHIPNVLQPR